MLRQDEADRLYRQIKDLTTSQLVDAAVAGVLNRYFRKQEPPPDDFDQQFFVEVMTEFSRDHDALGRALAGERAQGGRSGRAWAEAQGENPALLRQDEAAELLESVEDPITRELMGMAASVVLGRFGRREGLPVADFDFRFFMEVMAEFCGDHQTLRKVLAGEDLRWWPDEELELKKGGGRA